MPQSPFDIMLDPDGVFNKVSNFQKRQSGYVISVQHSLDHGSLRIVHAQPKIIQDTSDIVDESGTPSDGECTNMPDYIRLVGGKVQQLIDTDFDKAFADMVSALGNFPESMALKNNLYKILASHHNISQKIHEVYWLFYRDLDLATLLLSLDYHLTYKNSIDSNDSWNSIIKLFFLSIASFFGLPESSIQKYMKKKWKYGRVGSGTIDDLIGDILSLKANNSK